MKKPALRRGAKRAHQVETDSTNRYLVRVGVRERDKDINAESISVLGARSIHLAVHGVDRERQYIVRGVMVSEVALWTGKNHAFSLNEVRRLRH